MQNIIFYTIFIIHLIGFFWTILFILGEIHSDSKWWRSDKLWHKEILFDTKWLGIPIFIRIITWTTYFILFGVFLKEIILVLPFAWDIIFFIIYLYNSHKAVMKAKKHAK